jgi:type II secretory pathway component PulM
MKNMMKPAVIFWEIRSVKEKNLFFIGCGFILATTLWLLWLIPIIHERQHLTKQLPILRNQVARAALQSHQISLLIDQQDQEPEISLENLQKNLIAVGLHPKKILFHENNIEIEFEDSSFSKLIRWSYDAQINFHIVVAEASIAPLNEIDQVHAILIFKKLT